MELTEGAAAESDVRLALLKDWLKSDAVIAKVGRVVGEGGESQIAPATADASFRRYFRITTPSGTRIIMDAPTAQEDCRPFVKVAGLMRDAGVRAPQILAADLQHAHIQPTPAQLG